jgi:hypothetical protein
MMSFWRIYHSRILVGLFFLGYLALGLVVYDDYGLQWDSNRSFNRGQMTYDYIMKMDQIQAKRFDFHGWAFDAIVYFIQMSLKLTDIRDLYASKHLMTFFLFYVGVFFFYLLCRDHFRSWRMGLLGSIFLVLSPRIFADAFYNPKDIPCIAFFIIGIYTMIHFLKRMTIRRAGWHAFASGFLIDVRNVGILLPAITGLIFAMDWLKYRFTRVSSKQMLQSLLWYILLLMFVTVLFWPILWPDPWNLFLKGFKEMKQYPYHSHVLYMGEYTRAHQLPWHYIPVWIFISTPLVYSFFFLSGIIAAVTSFFQKSKTYEYKRNAFIFLLWFFAPIGAIIVLHSIVYDAWRQMLFVYPGFLLVALMGIDGLGHLARKIFPEKVFKILQWAFCLALLAAFAHVGYFMVKYHPHQNLYFNALTGGVKGAKGQFDMDYWGVSYRKGLEYILEHDSAEKIPIYVINMPGKNNANILKLKERERLVYVKTPEEAKYFLSNYRYHEEEYEYSNEFYSIKIDGVKILVVYQLKA